MMFRKVKNNKIFKNKYIMIPSYIFVGIMILNFLFLIITKESIFSWAFKKLAGYTEETKSIEISSPGYDSAPGSVKMTKSAEWTGRGEVTLTLDLDSVRIERDVPENIIVLLDISTSYGGEASLFCGDICDYIYELSQEVLSHDDSHFSFVTFATEARILVENTTNPEDIRNIISSIRIGGSTDFYKAFKKASEILFRTYDEEIETHVILISDGAATDSVGNDYEEYSFIKRTYPDVIVDGVQYGGGKSIKRVSDRQYYSDRTDLRDKLFDAGLSTEYYTNLLVQETFDDTYFSVVSDSIEKEYGITNITNVGGREVLNWNLADNRFKTGYETELKIKLRIKDSQLNYKGYVPTSISTNISGSANNMTPINFNSTLTPVLKTFFRVSYDANAPSGCLNNYNFVEDHYPFENVIKNVENLVCPGFSFKGFEVGDDSVRLMGSDYFVMPGYDVSVNAVWTSFTISKSFEGELTERATLYQYLLSQAELKNFRNDMSGGAFDVNVISSDTNGKGLYKVEATKDDSNPMLVFRGDVADNNVIFGGFCWKIVRTTPTGGVKMIYNGVPSGGSCTATGAATAIPNKSSWTHYQSTDSDKSSLAQTLGYMYGNEYPTYVRFIKPEYWPTFVGLSDPYIPSSEEEWDDTVKASDTIIYNNGDISLNSPRDISKSSNEFVGKYTRFWSVDVGTAGHVYYVTRSNFESRYNYVIGFNSTNLSEAVNAGYASDPALYYFNKAKAQNWYFANDVSYNASTGKYTLINTKIVNKYNFWDQIKSAQDDELPEEDKTYRHYTCLDGGTTTCSKVYYVFSLNETYYGFSYIELENGKKVENAISEMTDSSSNTKGSKIKETIDNWYVANLIGRANMLEDVVWCNDRTTTVDGTTWHKDGGWSFIYFADRYTLDLNACPSNDSFSVSSTIGNGKLNYPVGMITRREANFAGINSNDNASNYLVSGIPYYTMTPIYYNNLMGHIFMVSETGTLTGYSGGLVETLLAEEYYIRPMISLKPGVYISDGDGTRTRPYIIEE